MSGESTGEHESVPRISHSAENLRVVSVLWGDAHADGDGSWLRIEDIEDEPYVVRSAGFLLDEVKTGHVSLAQSLGAEEGVVDHVIHIPVAMVLSIRYIDGDDDDEKQTDMKETTLIPLLLSRLIPTGAIWRWCKQRRR